MSLVSERRPRRTGAKGCEVMFEQVSLEIGGRKLTFETGKMARQAHGAMVARYGDTVVLATACMDTQRQRKRFSSAHGGLPRIHLFRRKNSGRIFQARRASLGARNSGFAPDGPAAAAAVSRRLGHRNADRGHGAFRRQRERSGCDRRDRGLRGAVYLEDSFQQSDGVRARGIARRQAGGEPDRTPSRRRAC